MLTRVVAAEEAVKRLLGLANRDAYFVLGVASNAHPSDIKKCYRQQAILGMVLSEIIDRLVPRAHYFRAIHVPLTTEKYS